MCRTVRAAAAAVKPASSVWNEDFGFNSIDALRRRSAETFGFPAQVFVSYHPDSGGNFGMNIWDNCSETGTAPLLPSAFTSTAIPYKAQLPEPLASSLGPWSTGANRYPCWPRSKRATGTWRNRTMCPEASSTDSEKPLPNTDTRGIEPIQIAGQISYAVGDPPDVPPYLVSGIRCSARLHFT